ncbi:MAG: DNRLRE domain-containing protein [Anaerolineaceae bacterium]|nr:MAG: DNRLRE domain-containing protein [Anaerolineaceae bacterium]
MLKRIFHTMAVLVFLSSLLMATPAKSAAADADTKGMSPKAFLKQDGSLKLDGSFRGTLDLENWNVQLDPVLGPVFLPVAPQNNWAAAGTNGGPFNDGINVVAVNGTDVYVGGWFRDAGGVPEADHIAKWDGSQWSALSNGGSGQPALTSAVDAIVFIGSNLYAAGWFGTNNTSGSPIANAAKFAKWNGTSWSAAPGMTTNLNGDVEALAYDSTNNIIYVGGKFTDANSNSTADYVFGLDLDTNSMVTLGSNGASDGSLTNNVYALGVDSTGVVYAGGFFTDVKNGATTLNEADYIAKWDGANWSNLGNNGAGVGALNTLVVSIAIDASDNVYAGGSFTNAAGIATADYIAKWDTSGSSWSALGSNGSGNGALLATGNGSAVQEIIINGTDVYVGGFFIGSSGIPTADYVARFDTVSETWSGLGNNGSGNGSLNGGATGIAMSGGNLYVGGTFFDVNNGGTALPSADYFAIWDGSSWSTLGDSNGVFAYTVKATVVIGSDVYVGGSFVNLGGDPRIDYLARWDGSVWNPVGNVNQTYGSLNSTVESLAVDGTDLYAGGLFTVVYNEGTTVTGANRIAKWNGSTWSALGSGVNSSVFALAVDASHNVYAGGAFTNVNSIPEADYVAKWDGSWSALSGNGASNGALTGGVHTLATNGTDVYVGGDFASVLNTSNVAIANASYLAKWNGSTWSAMDGISSPISGGVYAVTISGTDVYVGGVFTSLNGINEADKIAKWDGAAWSALGHNGAGEGALTSYVNAIAVNGNRVYVGGNFTNVTNVDSTVLGSADYVAMWDGANWFALGSDGASNGSLNGIVQTLLLVDSDLWVGGNFQNANNNGAIVKEADYLALYGVDTSAPVVSSITRVDTNPTSKKSVAFTVTFSEPVLGIDAADFLLVKTGLTGSAITGASGSGAVYTVTVNTGSGDGTLRLDVPDGVSITDANLNPLGGLPFTGGEIYTVDRKLVSKSINTQDGWILESGENTNLGGVTNVTSTTLRLGDDASRKQYRSILSFNTSGLPNNAVITKVTLKVKQQGVTGGGNPVNTFQGFMVDIRKGAFGTSALQITDWQANVNKSVGPFKPALTSGWYTINLTTSKAYINKLATASGLTQIRLRFKLDDNNNGVANFLSLFSGNASAAARPQLIVEFYVP